MNILITGANGFIGRHLCERMKHYGSVVGIGLSDCSLEGITYCKMNVLDDKAINDLFAKYKFDKVIHAASVTFHDDIVNKKQMSLDVCFRGTENLITAFNTYSNGGLFIYTSTGKIYGGGVTQPIDELTPPNPKNALGKQKRMVEQIMDYYSTDKLDNKFVIFRMFNIYGYGQRSTFVIPYIMEQIKISDTISLGNLDDARDYLNVEDLVDCFDSLLKNYKAKNQLEHFNIGSGKAYSVKDILAIIEKATGRHFNINIDAKKLRHDETSIEYADIKKINQYIGWEPKTSMEQGLIDMLKKNKLIEGLDDCHQNAI